MKTVYKNKKLENTLISINAVTAAVIAATFVLLYGFDKPLAAPKLLHIIQITAMIIFLSEKIVRFINAASKKNFLRDNWYELPLLIILIAVLSLTNVLFEEHPPAQIQTLAIGLYLILQVVIKVCRTAVALAASGQNPTITLIASFLVLIIVGAGILMLPRSYNCPKMSFVDALFTATSATCVTGLIVKDTGKDFSFAGQIVILTLIQLGGLGIVIFGAVLALLLGQALTARESMAMQDLLSSQTLGRISRLIGFIFIATLLIESIGAVAMYNMWTTLPPASSKAAAVHQQWFCSIFHSISAFCNAGFSLFSTSLIDYSKSARVYTVIAPLIILGGLGFGVLFNLFNLAVDKIKSLYIPKNNPYTTPDLTHQPVRVRLQTKIVLTVSLILIVTGTVAILVFENNSPVTDPAKQNIPALQKIANAFFQSVTARTAGFNTVDIAATSQASKLVLIILMFIGGSPGSTAGGIKTVTLAVVIMVVLATLRKRPHVEIFKRSVPLAVLGRAVTVTILFAVVFITITFALSITEKQNAFPTEDIVFETGSALGTVGLTTGITPALTTAGKLVIIAAMLIGRLGPLTVLAAMTFNIKPARYEYPSEPLVVG